jgi:hypothetical protein
MRVRVAEQTMNRCASICRDTQPATAARVPEAVVGPYYTSDEASSLLVQVTVASVEDTFEATTWFSVEATVSGPALVVG